EDLVAPGAGVGVGGEPPRAPHVALGGGGVELGLAAVEPVAAHQEVGDGSRRRLAQHEHPAARADRHRDLGGVGRGRAQQERGPGGRFLDGFEQGVGGGLGEPVGVFDDEDLPAPRGGGPSSLQDQGADPVDAAGGAFGDDAGDVGVGAAEDGAAGVALAAPSGVALEGGGEGHGGGGTAGA